MRYPNLIILLVALAALSGVTYVVLTSGGPVADPDRPDDEEPVYPPGAEPAAKPPVEWDPAAVDRVVSSLGIEGAATPKAIGELARSEKGVREVLDILARSVDSDKRAAAMIVLGLSDRPEARLALATAVREETDRVVLLAALIAVSHLDSEFAVPILEEVALSAEDPDVLATSLSGLAIQAPGDALRSLSRMLAKGVTADRRRMIYETANGARFPIMGEVPEFVRLMQGGGTGLPPLTMGSDPATDKALEAFLETAMSERDRESIPVAALAIARIPGKKAGRALYTLWEAGDRLTRHMVMDSLDPGGEKIAEFIRNAPRMGSPEDRRALSRFLEPLSNPELVPDLKSWLASETDPEVRARIEETVKRLDER